MREGHEQLAAWLRQSADWTSPLHHIMGLSVGRTRALLRAGAHTRVHMHIGTCACTRGGGGELHRPHPRLTLTLTRCRHRRKAGGWAIATRACGTSPAQCSADRQGERQLLCSGFAACDGVRRVDAGDAQPIPCVSAQPRERAGAPRLSPCTDQGPRPLADGRLGRGRDALCGAAVAGWLGVFGQIDSVLESI